MAQGEKRADWCWIIWCGTRVQPSLDFSRHLGTQTTRLSSRFCSHSRIASKRRENELNIFPQMVGKHAILQIIWIIDLFYELLSHLFSRFVLARYFSFFLRVFSSSVTVWPPTYEELQTMHKHDVILCDVATLTAKYTNHKQVDMQPSCPEF